MSYINESVGLSVNTKNLSAIREIYGLYSELGELNSRMHFCGQTRIFVE